MGVSDFFFITVEKGNTITAKAVAITITVTVNAIHIINTTNFI